MLHKYYQKHKERLWKEVCERYQKLSEEEKEKRQSKWKKNINTLQQKKRKGIHLPLK